MLRRRHLPQRKNHRKSLDDSSFIEAHTMLPFHQYELLLASKSPRRRQLLSQIGIPVKFVDIDVSETITTPFAAEKVAEFLAVRKGSAFPQDKIEANQILVTADTVVVQSGKVLGKPKDREEAFSMLSNLSNNCDQVYTGVSLRMAHASVSFTECTHVCFRKLEKWEIDYYLDNFTYLDKAGSYGIQDWIGMVGVSRIEGCYYNVMGLPLAHLYQELLHLINKS